MRNNEEYFQLFIQDFEPNEILINKSFRTKLEKKLPTILLCHELYILVRSCVINFLLLSLH